MCFLFALAFNLNGQHQYFLVMTCYWYFVIIICSTSSCCLSGEKSRVVFPWQCTFEYQPPFSTIKNCNLLFIFVQMVRLVSPAGETGMLVVDSVVICASLLLSSYISKHVFYFVT